MITPRRVLMVLNSFEEDAPNRLCVQVARGLQTSRRYQCAFVAISRGGPLLDYLEEKGFPAEVLEGAGRILKLRRIFNMSQPDVVHAILTRPALYAIPAARLAGVPSVILTHHGSHEWYEKGWLAGFVTRVLYPAEASLADRVIAVSDTARAQLLRAGLSDDQVAVIPNGVDPIRFSPGNVHLRRDWLNQLFAEIDPDRHLLVGCAGNLRRIKGHHVLVEAAAMAVKSNPNLRFVIWGDGPERTKLMTRIEELGLASIFLLPGNCTGMEAALASCDMYVQPSLEESFGMAAAEAMSCGVPVVASDAGGLPELVGDCGLIVEKGDPKALCDALIKLAGDKTLRQQLGTAGRRRILLEFTSEKMVSRHLTLHDGLARASS